VTGDPTGSSHSLADVLPAAAAALGMPVRPTTLTLPPARHAVVVLVDGLGEILLARRSGHAPFLRQLRWDGDDEGARNGSAGAAGLVGHRVLRCGYPSTTATSMGSFGTGRPPGSHGLVGTDVLDPARDVVFSELAWDPDVDPRRWQPGTTVFEDVQAAGGSVVRIGPAYFDGSGLTEAALRGGRFLPADQLSARVDLAVAAIAAATVPTMVYLYWGEVDKVGHIQGCESWQWGEQLEQVDAALAQLADRLGPGCLLVVTADHGMVDVPMSARWDLAHDAELAAGIRLVGGEPRALHLYCEPGAAADVVATWRQRLGAAVDVRTRQDAVGRGWFGQVQDWVMPRIGDVVATMVDPVAVVDSRIARPDRPPMIGMHGASTAAEELIPVLWTTKG
jgi:Type I phosphodiesterase / nucleotide pyrophosphatase